MAQRKLVALLVARPAPRTEGYAAANQELDRLSQGDAELKRIGQSVLNRFRGSRKPASIDPSTIQEGVKAVFLSLLKPASASVGWLKPTYDEVPRQEKLLSIDGDYFASGIYAHAPAKHEYHLGKGWKRLRGRCGLRAGSGGLVDSEIFGDGRSLWTARGVSAGEGIECNVDVTGVEVLTCIVTDGGNGPAADWGVWIEPTLYR